MSKNSETGHAQNLGRMASALSIIDTLGASFNPVHDDIKPDALRTYLGECRGKQDAVMAATDAYDRAVNARRERYAALRKLATRVINAYIDAGAPDADVEDARAHKRRMDGNRPKAVRTPGQDEESVRQYSTSQRSFISLAEHFNSLCHRVTSFAGYRPSEAGLNAEALAAEGAALVAVNNAVDAAAAGLHSALNARNRLFYDEGRGMVARGKRLRSYFRTRSDGDNPIKGITFRNLV